MISKRRCRPGTCSRRTGPKPQVRTSVNKDNYKENCLWLAFKDAGVETHILESMKLEFKQRKIARKNIRKVAEDHKLLVTIATDDKKEGSIKNIDRWRYTDSTFRNQVWPRFRNG